MSIAREIEKRLERLVDGISAALFGGRMHPVDLANRLIREADLRVVDGDAGPTIPNFFRVIVASGDIDAELDLIRLGRELSHALGDAAADRGWRTEGPVQVVVTTDATIPPGTVAYEPETRPGDLDPWGRLIETNGDRVLNLADNRVLLGRADDVDCRIREPEVSRHHALVFRELGRVWLADLGSANGTKVNGGDVDGSPVALGPGDIVSLGPATFSLVLL